MTRQTLFQCGRGGTSVEFALVFPVFLVLAAGCMEYCRVLWMTQSLNAVAFNTARCATYGTGVSSGTNCATTAATQGYAVALAARYGITIDSSGVTSATNQTCRGNAGSVKVVVQTTFNSPFAGLVNTFPATISGTGCFKS
jgi:Flp pilus assembly protein TadG